MTTRGSGCGQPQAGLALNEVLKLNLNDVYYNIFQLNKRSQQCFMKKDLSKP